jgi:hypothetical protein
MTEFEISYEDVEIPAAVGDSITVRRKIVTPVEPAQAEKRASAKKRAAKPVIENIDDELGGDAPQKGGKA